MSVRIKETRKKFGDTLQSLSKKIDYDYSNLSKVERGIYTPSLELLKRIATVYNITIHDLLIESDQIQLIDLEMNNGVPDYSFTLDGQNISDDELDFLIQSIRIFRQTIQNHKKSIG